MREQMRNNVINHSVLQQIISVMDLTSLGENDTPEMIATLCKKASSTKHHVAAVCVFPKFVKQVATTLPDKNIKIATVVNFPQGNQKLSQVEKDIHNAIEEGANEIDLVLPYERYLEGDKVGAIEFIKQCRIACGDMTLKVILESGAIPELEILAEICERVILAGADFLKTSTGKIPQGASLASAEIMLLAIRNSKSSIKKTIGFKASGGIRTIEQASEYIQLAQKIMGTDWVTPQTFRIGASQLLDVALESL